MSIIFSLALLHLTQQGQQHTLDQMTLTHGCWQWMNSEERIVRDRDPYEENGWLWGWTHSVLLVEDVLSCVPLLSDPTYCQNSIANVPSVKDNLHWELKGKSCKRLTSFFAPEVNIK